MKLTSRPLVAVLAVVATASTALFLSGSIHDAASACAPGYSLKDPVDFAREIRPGISDAQVAQIRERFGDEVCLAQKHPESFGELMALNEQLAMAWGEAPPGALRQAIAQKQAMAAAASSVPNADGTWEQFGTGPLITDDPRYESVNGLGIGNNSGRVDSMDYDPVGNRVFASIGTGGVWMSDNLGDRWESIGDALPTQIIGAVAWTSAGGGTVIAGSGEPLNGGNTYVGMGAFWTSDLGATWNQATGIPDGGMTYQVEVDPGHPEIVYVATSLGLYRSSDAGRTYVNVALPTSPECAGVTALGPCQFANYVTDVVVKEPGGSPAVVCLPAGCPVLAAVGFRNGKKAFLDGKPHAPRNGLYRSDTGAAGTFAWLDVSGDGASNIGFALEDHIGRVEMGNAVGPQQDHNYVYAAVQDAVLLNGGVSAIDVADDAPVGAPVAPTVLNGIYVSPDFGSSWIRMADENEITYNAGTGSSLQGVGVALGVGPGAQAWYNLYIKPDPTRQDPFGVPTRLIFGLEEVWTNRTPNVGLNGIAQQGDNDFKVIGGYYAGTSCLLLDTGLPACPANDSPAEHTSTHPDQHEGLWIPDATGGGVTFLAGNDGGVYRQHAAASEEMDNTKWGMGNNAGFYTLLPYSGAVANDCTVWFGLQDNGSGKIEPGSRQIFETIGGDGTISVVDPGNSDVAYIQIQNGAMNRTTDGGRSWTGIAPTATTSPLFVNPLAMDPTDARHLMTGGPEIVETLDGPNATTGNWIQVFNLGTTPNTNPAQKRKMTAVDLEGDAAYVGYCGLCNVFTTRTALNQEFAAGIATNVGGGAPPARGTGDGWHFATGAGLPNRYVTAIEIDPAAAETVYVSLGMYENRQWAPPGQHLDPNANIGSGHVFKSVDAGESFVDISGNLPDVPVFWVTLRGTQLLAGTQIGAFISSDTDGTLWAPLGTNLPNVPIAQLTTSPGDLTQMFAATFGRGIWRYRFPGEPDICIAPVAPVQTAPTVETPAASGCGHDADGNYTLNFSYTAPTGGVDPVAFEIQEATVFADVFFDDADETLSSGSNSTWQGTGGWTSQVNPNSGSVSYHSPATMDQVETLTMIDAVGILPGSATLTFDTTQSTEACCDFVSVEVSTDDGASFESVASWSGDFIGERQVDLSPYTGNAVKLRFRLTADQLVGGPGVFIENVRINAGNFATIGEAGAGATTFQVSGRKGGERHYRIAGFFGAGRLLGPYSNVECAVVDLPPNVAPIAEAGADFSVNEGSGAMLSAAGSSDPDGAVLDYSWQQTLGPAVTLDGGDTAAPTFTAPEVDADTALTFTLTVTDFEGATASDTITVTVLARPSDPLIGNNTVGSFRLLGLLALGLLGLARVRRSS